MGKFFKNSILVLSVLTMVFGVFTFRLAEEKTISREIPKAHANHCKENEDTYHPPRGGQHYCVPKGTKINVATGQDSPLATPPNPGSCNLGDVWCYLRRGIAGLLLLVPALILWIAGAIFDFAVGQSVVEFTKLVQGAKGITIAWSVLRDIVNMAFIFILLYIAIATILRIEEYSAKRLLSRIILVALLINFSLFFTRVVIDASNVLTAEFVDAIKTVGGTVDLTLGDVGLSDTEKKRLTIEKDSISGTFMGPLAIATFFGSDGKIGGPHLNDANILTIGIFSAIFFLITAFILLAGAALLIIRVVVFVFLMITSPLAFAAMILPKTQGLAKEWWDTLFKYALFAPVYMALLLAVAIIIHDPTFIKTSVGDNGFAELLGGNRSAVSSTIFNFFVIGGLMIGALVAAQKLGIKGAETFSQWGKALSVGAGSRALRYVGGRWNEATSKIVRSIDDEDHSTAGKWKARGKKLAFLALNPVQFGKQWEAKAQERLKMRETVAGGAASEVVSWITTFGTEKLDDKALARRKLISENMSELREQMGPDIDKADAREYIKRVANIMGLEGDLKREAFLKLVHQQGYGDDITEVISVLSDDDKQKWAKKFGLSEDSPEETKVYTDVMSQIQNLAFLFGPGKANEAIEMFRSLRSGKLEQNSPEYLAWLKKGDNQDKLRVLSDLTPLAKGVGHFEQMYSAVRDEKIGGYRLVVDTVKMEEKKDENGDIVRDKDGNAVMVDVGKKERTQMILGEANKIPIRDFMRQITWHNFMAKKWNKEKEKWEVAGLVDENGELIISDYQRAIIENMGDEHYSQATHMQPRSIKYSVGAWVKDELSDGELVFHGDTDEERRMNEMQYRKLEELNRGFAHALKNVSLYGQVDRTPKKAAERAKRRIDATEKLIEEAREKGEEVEQKLHDILEADREYVEKQKDKEERK